MLQRVYTRVSKPAARYSDRGSAAEHCSACRFFMTGGDCARVLGRVMPQGWCKFFSREAVQRWNPLWPTAGIPLPPGVSLDLSFLTPSTLDPRITFTRASTATYFDRNGVMQTAAVNAPRWDYSPNMLALNGLLIEEARTNLCLWSGDLSHIGWGGQSSGGPVSPVTTGNAAVAPDGTTTAARIVFPAVSGASALSEWVQTIAIGAGSYVGSMWLKGSVGGEQIYLMSDNDVAAWNRTLAVLSTSWQRFTVVIPSYPAGNLYFQLGVDLRDAGQSSKPAQTIYAWGAQVELGAFPTSYIPAAGATVTRSADLASMPTAAWFNTTNGTYQAEFIPNGAAAGLPVVISGNAGSPMIATGADSRLTAGIRSGAAVFSATGPLYTFGAVNKAAFAYLSGASNAAVNGTSFGPSATALTVTGTVVEFGSDGVTPGNNALDGWLRRVRYWPRILANAEMQSVTT